MSGIGEGRLQEVGGLACFIALRLQAVGLGQQCAAEAQGRVRSMNLAETG